MTQPIQEPSTGRSISGLDWGQSQIARRPASVNPDGIVAWIALCDDGCNENIDGSSIPVVFDQGYISDNAGGIFDLTNDLETTTACGVDTPVYHGFIKASGVYTFALELEGSFDHTQVTPPASFTFSSQILPLSGASIPPDYYFPGYTSGLETRQHIYIPSGLDPGDETYHMWAAPSWTIPIVRPDGLGTGDDEIIVNYAYTPAFDQFFTFQLRVTYHGPVNYTGTFDPV